ncbi:MAG: class I SAM-dependent methyltransferase [Pseudomonadota bacterium]
MTEQKYAAGLVRAINRLWLPVYKGIALQVAEHCTCAPGRILEIGCFSGGTGIELLRIYGKSSLTVALGDEDLVKTFSTDWADSLAGLDARRVSTSHAAPGSLDLPDSSQDVVFCRGVFFFLEASGAVLREAYRVLMPGGFAFLGGGFGSHTPDAVRAALAGESRVQNNALGRKIYSHDEFQAVIAGAGLASPTTLIQEGGLWALIRKEKSSR